MTTDEIMNNEAELLIDYLLEYAENIYDVSSPALQKIMKRWDCTSDYDFYSILSDSIERFYFCYSPSSPLKLNIHLNYGECETEVNMIDADCIDDWTINGNYAYYSTYGFIVELNANKLLKSLKEYTEERE